jgi:hypothetical protein
MGKDIRGFETHIASPCSVEWSSMTGTERARQCGLCHRSVYELSSLTRAEVEALVAEPSGCVTFHQRDDGTVLTADCTVGARVTRRAKVLGLVARGVGIGAVALALSGSLGLCVFAMAPHPRSTAHDIPPEPLEVQTRRLVREQRDIEQIRARDAAAPFTSKEYIAAAVRAAEEESHSCTEPRELRATPEPRAPRRLFTQVAAPKPDATGKRRTRDELEQKDMAAQYLRAHPEPVK